MIEAQGLTKHFDAFVAVDDVSLSVSRGELLALLGPNGAGKTTTVRMLSAILRPTRGCAFIDGHNVVMEADRVRRSIGLLTEQPGLYERMSGLEYLEFYGRLYGLRDVDVRQRGIHLFERFAMAGRERQRLSEYSKGMRQKIGIIRAMLHNPKVLLLDEPTSAMDPHSAKLVRDAIEELRQDARAILLCTHNLAEAERLADRIAIIRHGRIVALDTPAGLKERLLGHPKMRLELDQVLNGFEKEIADLVTISQVAGKSVQYETSDPIRDNPLVVQRATTLGLGVVSLEEVSYSLEDVYLRAVGDQVEGGE